MGARTKSHESKDNDLAFLFSTRKSVVFCFLVLLRGHRDRCVDRLSFFILIFMYAIKTV